LRIISEGMWKNPEYYLMGVPYASITSQGIFSRPQKQLQSKIVLQTVQYLETLGISNMDSDG
jgi:hypothetical protein